MDVIKNEEFKNSVDKIVYWSKLFAVLFIIMGIFLALGAISASFAGNIMTESLGLGALGGLGFGIFFIYGLIAAIYLIPGIWLLNFCNKTRKGLNQNNESLFVEGFKYFGNYYKFWGVLTTVILIIYGLSLFIILIAALAGGL